jgi:hypothetical protein
MIQLFPLGLAGLHLEDQLNSLLDIGPQIRFQFREDKHPIDIHLKGAKPREKGLFLFTQVVVFCIAGIAANLLKMLRRLHLGDDDVVPETHALQCQLSDLLEMGEIFGLVVQGTPRVLVAIDAELHLHQ